MNTQQTTYVTRNDVMKLLSDDEVAKVSTNEAGMLKVGEEYVDLTRLSAGVAHALKAVPATGHMLRRSSVQESTWNAIVKKLSEGRQVAKA